MAKKRIVKKTMYVVERFLPPECPKCRHKFDTAGTDWSIFLGDKEGGEKVIRETTGYTIIVCSHCQNFTACIQLVSWMLSDPEAARRLLKQGFVNFHEVEAFGNMTEDHCVVHAEIPGIRVMAVKVE